MIILGTNSIKASGFNVDNSCRFNGTSSYMTKTLGTPTSAKKGTISYWFKQGSVNTGTIKTAFSFGAEYGAINYDTGTTKGFEINLSNGNGWYKGTNTGFTARDPSAWWHLMVVVDTTQGTEANRFKFYMNGSQITFTSGNNFPSSNGDIPGWASGQVMQVGRRSTGDANYFDGYMAEVVFIDGSALTPSDFGEYDSDSPTIWKPKDVSGLTFGNNGFYLDFKDSSNLGNDANGGTDLTETGLDATNQTTDTCTNNFATLNPLMNNLNNLPTLSEGNLEVLAVSGSTWSVTPSTIGLPKSGKWYYEVEAVSGTSGDRAAFAGWINPAVSNPLANGSILWRNVASTNSILSNDSPATGSFSATTWGTNGNIIGMYIDMDNSKLYFAHNGTIQNSGTGINFQGTFDDDTFILPVVMVINTDKLSVNFGNPAANFAIASGNTDVNGFGNFEFDPSAGTFDGASKDFLAICTKNIAEVS